MVVGLGLIGQLTARLLVAKGCEVLGLDPSPERTELAAKHGVKILPQITTIERAALTWTQGKGVDGVIIAASSASSEIVNHSALGCKPRAKIISVGVVGTPFTASPIFQIRGQRASFPFLTVNVPIKRPGLSSRKSYRST
jgi:threonine dehydrogenase-like Zn-dependent dehydrogenase